MVLSLRRSPNILRVLDKLGKEEDLFSSLTDDLFHFHGFSPLKGIHNPDFSPALDFVEKEKEYVIKAEENEMIWTLTIYDDILNKIFEKGIIKENGENKE